MYMKGHVTDNEQAIKLYEEYGIPYKVLKRSGEVQAKMSTGAGSYNFQTDVEAAMKASGAGGFLDHKEVCVREDGSFVYILSPYNCHVTEELQDRMRMRGYNIIETHFRPYMGVNAIVVVRR